MKTYAFLLRYALLALPLACASLMSSCSDDDDGGTYDNGPVTVRLNVSAAQIGDLNGTRAEGDIVPADEHEFINTLKVYIVNDSNQIVQDLSPDLSSNILAQTGDLEEWHSDPITIAPGTYTVYAFANIEKYNGETDDTQNLTGEAMLGQCFPAGGTLNTATLNAYRIKNPAENIDFGNEMYIPMSGVSEKLTVTSDMNNGSGAGFTVHLDRLVSKVKMTISDFPETVNENTTFTFFGYSQNVPLMEDSTSSAYYGDRTGEFTAKLSEVEDTEGVRQFSFYANETPDSIPFTVTLATDNTTGVTTYTASPRCRELPRNTVYPLTLTFPDYAPVIEWRSWVAAIGNYPVEVKVDAENYTVYIAEGAQFEFTVAGMESSTNTAKLESVQWTVPDDLAGKIKVESNSGVTLSAALSAGVGVDTDLPLSVTVSWFATIEETNLLTRTYNVIINTIDITDVDFMTGTRAGGSYGMRLLGGEVLNMFKVN